MESRQGIGQWAVNPRGVFVHFVCNACLAAATAAGALEEDALLEAVVLLGALAGQPEFDESLAGCGLVSAAAACWHHACLLANPPSFLLARLMRGVALAA
jgi:hypothetical protein